MSNGTKTLKAQPEISPAEGVRLNVLMVDDEGDIGKFMRLKLAKEAPHISFSFVESGRDCLSFLDNNEVDCVLSDYQMPAMNGMELLSEIRRHGSDVPFIFITGQGNEEVAREAFKNGAYDYFTKEIGFAHFTRIVNSIEQAVRQRAVGRFREAAEYALHHEKLKYETILANIGDGISIQDREYRVIYQNKAHSDLVGVHTGEYCYKVYSKKDAVCEDCPLALSFEDGGVHSVEHTTVKDGKRVYVDIKTSTLRDASGNIVAGIEVVRDVTEKKRAAEALRESEDRFRTLFQSANDAIFLMDRNTFVDCNQKAAEILGYNDSSEIIGRTLADFSPNRQPDGSPSLNTALKYITAALKGKPQLFCWRHTRKDGSALDVEVSLNTFKSKWNVYLLAVLRDITERKKAEEEVLRANEMLKALLDGVNFGMMVVGKDRRVRTANRAALRMIGYDSEDAVRGRNCHSFICPAEEGKCPIMDLGMKIDLSERFLLNKAGEKVAVLKSVSPIMLGGEEVLLETFVHLPAAKAPENK